MEPEAKGSPDPGAGAVSPGRQAGEQGAPVRRPDTAEEWDNFITRYVQCILYSDYWDRGGY